MKFLEKGLSIAKGVACFDDMGLGKTIQAGGTLKFHPELWPTLWVVKSGIKYQTSDFIINWMGDDFVPQIINTSKDWLIPGLRNYIISYDMLVAKTRTLKNGTVVNSGFDITQFDRVGIKCVVLDECQQIKNVDASRTQMVRKVVKDRKVIPLSGTPWNNRGSELFPALNMMDPIKFHSAEGFKRQWVDTYWSGNQLKEGGIRNVARFREYTKDIIIRRERSVVMPELPATNRTKLNVTMDAQQEAAYDEAVENFMQWFEDHKQQATGIHILAAMARLRQLVGLAKIPATLDYVDEFVEDTDRKLIVFAHHVDVQAMLYDAIVERYSDQFPIYRITADTKPEERYNIQVAFNKAPRAIIVASQLAAGEGLNLQTCSDIVMHERQWNPGKEQQCEDRVARIGQESKHINAIYTHMQGLTAIDAQLDAIVEGKRVSFHKTMNNTEMQTWSENAIGVELGAAIIKAHKAKKAARS
jgi:SNF2 family DNA or RNA helicase